VTARRAIVVERPNEVAVVTRDLLSPEPQEVICRPLLVGVCGTDLELVGGDIDPAYVRYPLTLGHEWVGTVSRLGTEVADVAIGDRVVGEGVVPCGHCDRCREGATNLCDTYLELGFNREGAASDEVAVPARLIHRIHDNVPAEAAVLIEPAAVVYRGLERAQPRSGASVLVIGAGSIGLLATHLIRLWSPSTVAVFGRGRTQSELALTLGADRFACEADGSADPRRAFERPNGFDLVIEAAGRPEAVETAIRSARRGGTIVLLGLAGSGRTARLSPDELVNGDLTIHASFSYTSAAWARTVALVNAGAVRLAPLVTHRFPLERFQEALSMLGSRREPTGKIVLDLARGS
jgi:2-desacetyl-2-hydroxyethyl bacteriochlorophyllide A dehydrogenase